MMRSLLLLVGMVLVGCASTKSGEYRPVKSNEREAFGRADRSVNPEDVRKNFRDLENTEMAWAGVITKVDYEEKERQYLVAFEIDHRNFDWMNHGGGEPFQLSSEGQGKFLAGWYANKPTSIWRLQQLAAEGDMIIVYGKPYRMKDGVIQLAATAIRPIRDADFKVLQASGSPAEQTPED